MTEFSAQGQCLIAMPDLSGGFFEESVVVMCEHDAKGALGFTLNKPSDLSLLTLFRDLDLPAKPELGEITALLGGPVETQRGFVLSQVEHGDCNEPIPGLYINSHTQDLPRYVNELISGKALFVLGYAGWSAGQLTDEMLENSWLTAPWSADLAFDTPIQHRHHKATQTLGFDWFQLSATHGNA